MPDDVSCSELGDFVRQMIPDGDPVLPKAKEYIGSIPVDSREFSESKQSTAELYAWLATR